MEHLTAIMILIGCTGQNTCHELPAPTVGYETSAECVTQLQPALRAAVKGTKQVYGTCADVGSSVFEKDASVVWDLSKDGKISVSVVDDDARMAHDESIVASR